MHLLKLMKNVISLQAYEYKNVHIHGIPFTLVNLLSQNIREQNYFFCEY